MATIARAPKASGIRYKAIIKRPGLPLPTKTFRNKSDAKVWARRIESHLERSVALGDPGLAVTLDEAAQTAGAAGMTTVNLRSNGGGSA